jgi:hypothetical protein
MRDRRHRDAERPGEERERVAPHHPILALQRSMGNAAVARMLARAPLAPHDIEGFSPEEQQWIDEVWALEEIQLLFGSNPSIPQVLLERVAVISGNDPQGQTEEGESVEMADAAYTTIRPWNPEGSGEVEFKSTLIHELFHVLVSKNWDAGAVGGIDAPLRLSASLTHPEASALKLWPYAFGWFDHPRVHQACHLGWDELRNILAPLGLQPTDPMYPLLEDTETWEASPDDRDPEEDMATSLGMYLTNQAGREHLAQHFPLRHMLIEDYFQTVKVQAENAAGVPSVKGV